MDKIRSGTSLNLETTLLRILNKSPARTDRMLISRDISNSDPVELETTVHAALLRGLSHSCDLVTQIEVANGSSTRVWSNEAHRTILGHDPASCNGIETSLTHLYSEGFINQLPHLIAQFEEGLFLDGSTVEVGYLHADGHQVCFEGRIKLDPCCKSRFLCILRDITDRLERQRLELKTAQNEALCAAHERHALALGRISDVVMEVHIDDWSDPLGSCQVVEANEAYPDLFGVAWSTDLGAWPMLSPDGAQLRSVLVRAADLSPRVEVSFVRPDSEVRIVRVSTMYREDYGANRLLVVCHDLSDFKYRIEVEKDRKVAARLQHEEKNGHRAQQVSVQYAAAQIRIVEEHLIAHENAATQFVSPELKGVWLSLSESYKASSKALAEALATMHGIDERAQQALDDTHLRVMMYQLGANDYVPAQTVMDVAARLKKQLAGVSDVCVKAFELPEVECDWTLMWYGLENAISNARKHGAGGTIELALQYKEPMLTVQVTNAADPATQAPLLAKYGTDATKLLHRRIEGDDSQSTNLGGQALFAVARLLAGTAVLQLAPTTTRLRLEVRAPRPVEVVEISKALLVYFIDDAPTMRMMYQMWISQSSPLDPGSRVFPPDGLEPAATDEAMRTFYLEVLAARPRPCAVVLDQFLSSQVSRHAEATTGTEIATMLRSNGFRGIIIIRSANVSAEAMKEYLAAGADAVMSKDDSREKLVGLLVEQGKSFAQVAGMAAIDAPLLVTDAMWASADVSARDRILGQFRRDARKSLDELLALLKGADLGNIPRELHNLVGLCRTIGARRMQLVADACKAGMGHAQLGQLEDLLAQTFVAMDAHCSVTDAATKTQVEHAARLMSKHGHSALEAAAVDVTECPLIDWPQARAVALLQGFLRAEMTIHLSELRAAVAAGESCRRLLHSLCGKSSTLGAPRLARFVAQCEKTAQSFSEAKLRVLEALHAETVEALDMPSAALPHSHAALSVPELVPEPAAKELRAPPVSPVRAALPAPEAAAEPSAAPIFVAAIDDDDIARSVLDMMLFSFLGADKTRSCALGKTREEQDSFLNFALGRVDKELQPLPPPHQQADIVVADQNIIDIFDGGPDIIGTDLVAQLRDAGFTGVACIVSGCDLEELAELEAQPGVDLAVLKGFDGQKLAAQLLKLHAERRASATAHGGLGF